jgi:hypothetical protein
MSVQFVFDFGERVEIVFKRVREGVWGGGFQVSCVLSAGGARGAAPAHARVVAQAALV